MKIHYIVIILFAITSLWIITNNTYMDFKIRKCVILNKIITPPGYKQSANLYLVLKEERGIVFDLIVAPATYTQHNVGDTIYFNLRDFDIRQTPRDNVIFFFGQIVMIAITIALIILIPIRKIIRI